MNETSHEPSTVESVSLGAVVDTAAMVASTTSRTEKTEALAALLGSTPPAHAPIVVGLLTGEVRQGRIGVGWAALRDVDVVSASTSSLDVEAVDGAITDLANTSGPGSRASRSAQLGALFTQATQDEGEFLRAVLSGGLRQGALDGVMVAAIAKAAGVPQAVVRRAAMLSGDLGETAERALRGGRSELESVGLRVGRGVLPMLAATSATAGEAVVELGETVVQAKLDGIRIQAHRHGEEVRLFTRNLNDVTERLPDVVALMRSLAVDSVVLDGELIGVFDDGPELFQDTASTFSSGGESGRVELQTQFFDILHLDGVDVIDEPLSVRLARLRDVVGDHRVEGIVTADPAEADAFSERVVSAGHEGVMVKALDSVYAAGKRGKTWRKVKPVHTFDLVVLGAEWGHGRRTGTLSNLHLGARRGSANVGSAGVGDGTVGGGSGSAGVDGGTVGDDSKFVMVGKTFKGLTDELLEWQTRELLARRVDHEGRGDDRDAITVFVRPELVVEIAIDGVQRSTTYDGGLALRFARVKGYRTDKSPADANTLDDLRSLL